MWIATVGQLLQLGPEVVQLLLNLSHPPELHVQLVIDAVDLLLDLSEQLPAPGGFTTLRPLGAGLPDRALDARAPVLTSGPTQSCLSSRPTRPLFPISPLAPGGPGGPGIPCGSRSRLFFAISCELSKLATSANGVLMDEYRATITAWFEKSRRGWGTRSARACRVV